MDEKLDELIREVHRLEVIFNECEPAALLPTIFELRAAEERLSLYFRDWKEVDTKKAKEYVSFIKGTITNMTDDEKNKYINDKRLRGTTVEKLERMKI